MVFGFTGTSAGMTVSQRATVRRLFRELALSEIHLGDCVGADEEAHEAATLIGVASIGHPPSNDKLRAFCVYAVERLPKPYLLRDRDIVTDGRDGLIAAPRQMTEPKSKRGEGTWTTVGYARQAGRRIWIVWPDGTIKHE